MNVRLIALALVFLDLGHYEEMKLHLVEALRLNIKNEDIAELEIARMKLYLVTAYRNLNASAEANTLLHETLDIIGKFDNISEDLYIRAVEEKSYALNGSELERNLYVCEKILSFREKYLPINAERIIALQNRIRKLKLQEQSIKKATLQLSRQSFWFCKTNLILATAGVVAASSIIAYNNTEVCKIQ